MHKQQSPTTHDQFPLKWKSAQPSFCFLAHPFQCPKADSAIGLKTVATVFGRATAAQATAAVALATLATIPLLGGLPVVVAVWLLAGIWAMGLPAIALVRNPTSTQATTYFNHASTLPVLLFGVALIAAAL